MRPAGLLAVLDDVWFRTPALVVELGSGVSTIVLARLLRELGTGRLLAVEHDDAWADRVQRQLDREGLTDVAAVVRAPLRPHQRSWNGADWYDEAAVAAAVTAAGGRIDVLLVDGPPAWRPGFEHARYPALGSLAAWLLPGATVVLDDIERAGEQAVLGRWREEHAVDFEVRPAAGVAVAAWPGA
jgi:predicted O-methyltransferase YrrM